MNAVAFAALMAVETVRSNGDPLIGRVARSEALVDYPMDNLRLAPNITCRDFIEGVVYEFEQSAVRWFTTTRVVTLDLSQRDQIRLTTCHPTASMLQLLPSRRPKESSRGRSVRGARKHCGKG